MTDTLLIKNLEDLARLGRIIGANLSGGEILELVGSLGAGKTTLAKEILAGAGVLGGFSPTFILDAVYDVKKGSLKAIHHLDLYRLKAADELLTLGLYDLIGRNDTALLIEWADRFPISENIGKMRIEIKVEKDASRRLTFKASDEKHEKILRDIINTFG